mgnify:CR=1 FL=1
MDELNHIFQEYINQGKYPGIQWQIIHKNISYEGKVGYKNLDTKENIQDDTLYRIWSMTKPIIAIAAMQLVEKNLMKLSDPINLYLPEFSDLKVLNNEEEIITNTIQLEKQPTIKDLLLHTAGFSYNFLADPVGKEYDQIKLFNSSTSSLEEEVRMLAKIPLLYHPSSKWRYSVSMDVLGRILEVILKSPLQDILKNQIFLPLGMNDTDFYISETNASRLMQSYEYNLLENKLTEHILDAQKIGTYGYPLHNKNYARGGHGLFSTIKDYILFAEMLHSGKSEEGKEIISKKTINYMTTNLLNPNLFPIEIASVGTIKDENYVNGLEPYGWGLGFRTLIDPTKNNNLGSKGEFGWAGAAATYFLVDSKKEISAVLMTQALNGDPSLINHFYKFIYTHF